MFCRENLNVVLARNNMKQKDLCKVLNLTEVSISKKVSLKAKWTLEDVNLFSKHFGKEETEFVFFN